MRSNRLRLGVETREHWPTGALREEETVGDWDTGAGGRGRASPGQQELEGISGVGSRDPARSARQKR
jgi:hypothetical protein